MISKTELLLMIREAGFLLYDAGYGPEVLHTEPLRYSQKCFERFAEMVIDHYRSKSALDRVAQRALEALEMSRRFVYADNRPQCDEAIDALRAALAQQDEPVATVTECEACFTPDVCQLRGTCDYYTASQMRIATPPQSKPLTEEPAQKQVTYSTGGLHLEAGFYSEVDLRRMLKALESMNAAARRAMEDTK